MDNDIYRGLQKINVCLTQIGRMVMLESALAHAIYSNLIKSGVLSREEVLKIALKAVQEVDAAYDGAAKNPNDPPVMMRDDEFTEILSDAINMNMMMKRSEDN